MIMILRQVFIFPFIFCLLSFSPVFSQSITELGKKGSWTAYTYTEESGKVCYMASKPKSAKGNYRKRGDIWALVTHRPNDKSNNVVSIITGYPYKENSEVNISIGSSKFIMFTVGQRAWNRDENSDEKMVRSMIRGANMVVKGTSSRGTLTTDSYSLSGFTAVHKIISQACGIYK